LLTFQDLQRNNKQSAESNGNIRKIEYPGLEKTNVDIQKVSHRTIGDPI
jgi:hypothetical protein